MGAEKAKLKMEIAHQLGCEFDDALDGAQKDVLRWEGSARGMREGAKAVEALLGHVAADVKEQKISIEAGDYAQKQLKRGAEVLRSLALRSEAMVQKTSGRAEAFQTVVKATKKIHDTEAQKAEGLESDDGNREPDERGSVQRPVGAHPGASLADQRKAEDAENEEHQDEVELQESSAE